MYIETYPTIFSRNLLGRCRPAATRIPAPPSPLHPSPWEGTWLPMLVGPGMYFAPTMPLRDTGEVRPIAGTDDIYGR